MKIKTTLIAMFLFCLFIVSISYSQEITKWQTTYSLQIKIFKNDTVILSDISSVNSTISNFPQEKTDYVIKILSNKNEELFKANLGISFKLSIDPIGTIDVNDTVTNPRVPFYPTAKYIVIYHSSKKIANIDLSKYFCNKNSVCDLGENEYVCPEDCKIKKNVSSWFYISLGIAIISLVAFLILLKLKPKSQNYSNLYQKWK